MIRRIRLDLCSLALIIGLLFSGGFLARPASAYPGLDVDIEIFFDALAPYGNWVDHRTYGRVWYPRDVPRGWRPYTHGHWAHTQEYGWLWVSDWVWGWAPFHYGRWTFDDWYGWIWIPGRIWAPAWVFWRYGNGYAAWAPMPPTVIWRPGLGISLNFFSYDRDLRPDCWVAVREHELAHRHMRRSIVEPRDNPQILRITNNVTHVTVIHNTIVNPGVPVRRVEQLLGRPIPPIRLRETERFDAIRAHETDHGVLEIVRPRLAPPSEKELHKEEERAVQLAREHAERERTSPQPREVIQGGHFEPRVPGRLTGKPSPDQPPPVPTAPERLISPPAQPIPQVIQQPPAHTEAPSRERKPVTGAQEHGHELNQPQGSAVPPSEASTSVPLPTATGVGQTQPAPDTRLLKEAPAVERKEPVPAQPEATRPWAGEVLEGSGEEKDQQPEQHREQTMPPKTIPNPELQPTPGEPVGQRLLPPTQNSEPPPPQQPTAVDAGRPPRDRLEEMQKRQETTRQGELPLPHPQEIQRQQAEQAERVREETIHQKQQMELQREALQRRQQLELQRQQVEQAERARLESMRHQQQMELQQEAARQEALQHQRLMESNRPHGEGRPGESARPQELPSSQPHMEIPGQQDASTLPEGPTPHQPPLRKEASH